MTLMISATLIAFQSTGIPKEAQTPLGLLAFVLVLTFGALAAAQRPLLQKIIGAVAGLAIVATGMVVWRSGAEDREPAHDVTAAELRLAKGEPPVELGAGYAAQLKDIETLAGKRDTGAADTPIPGTGHGRNQQLPEAPYVFQKVLGMVTTSPSKTAADVQNMSEAAWEEFLGAQDHARAERLKQTPFERIETKHNGISIAERWYFRGDDLTLPNGETWQLSHVYNVRPTSGESEAVYVTRRRPAP